MKQLVVFARSFWVAVAGAAQESATPESPSENVVDRAQGILEEARAARDEGDPEAARTKARQSITLLLEVEDADETTDWIYLLISTDSWVATRSAG